MTWVKEFEAWMHNRSMRDRLMGPANLKLVIAVCHQP